MKILHISDTDSGGAGTAACRSCKALLNHGIDSSLLVRKKTTLNPFVVEVDNKPANAFQKFNSRINVKKNRLLSSWSNDRNCEVFASPVNGLPISKNQLVQQADIINFHWVSGFVNLKSFFNGMSKPVVWTLHDQNPFMGGFHYDFDKFENSENKRLLLLDVYYSKLKEHIYKNHDNISVITLSSWMEKCVKQSRLLGGRTIYKVPNTLNTNVFKPRDGLIGRKLLGIPENATVVMFICESLKNKRKGFSHILHMLENNHNIFKDVFFLAVGQPDKSLATFPNVINTGKIMNENILSFIYSSADVVLVPSLQDNFPNVILEAMACGTPVVAYPSGGIVDMVNDFNGTLTSDATPDALKHSLLEYLVTIKNSNRASIRESFLNQYAPEIHAEKLMEIYQNILNKDS